jgi:hypothetical protein
MYGAQAAELIRELKRAAEHLLPYYNVSSIPSCHCLYPAKADCYSQEDLIRQILDEVKAAETLFATILE